MPLVNPMTTGRGMNLTAEPRPVTPSTDQQNAGHDRAHEQAVDAVDGDDAGDDDDEGAGGSADLSPRAAEGRDQKSGDDGGVDSGLRSDAGGDGEGHGQRQSDEADGDAGDEIPPEFAQVVVAQANYRLRQPAVVREKLG